MYDDGFDSTFSVYPSFLIRDWVENIESIGHDRVSWYLGLYDQCYRLAA
jgi:hypothetical protein